MGKEDAEVVPEGVPDIPLDSSKNDEKRRYFRYTLENMMRASEELYHICIGDKNLIQVEEVTNALHKIMVKFDTYEKILRMDERKLSASSLECTEFLDSETLEAKVISQDKESFEISDQIQQITFVQSANNEVTTDNTNKEGANGQEFRASNSPGINVSAPDFIPSYLRKKTDCSRSDQSVQTSRKNKYDKIKERKSSLQEGFDFVGETASIKSPMHFDHTNQTYSDSQEFQNYFSNNYSPNLVSPNVFPYTTHPSYQSYSPHYISPVPHYNVPYSVYSLHMRNSNLVSYPTSAYEGQHLFQMHHSYRSSGRFPKVRFPNNFESKSSKTTKIKKQQGSAIVDENFLVSHDKISPNPYVSDMYVNGDSNDKAQISELNFENVSEDDSNQNSCNNLLPKSETLEVEKIQDEGNSKCDETVDVKTDSLIETMPVEKNTNLDCLWNKNNSDRDEIFRYDISEDKCNNFLQKSNKNACEDAPIIDRNDKKTEEAYNEKLLQSHVIEENNNNITSKPSGVWKERKDSLDMIGEPHSIFGLPADECQLHFPELSSDKKRKGNRSRIPMKLPFKKTEKLDFSVKTIEEKTLSFSEITKCHPVAGKQLELLVPSSKKTENKISHSLPTKQYIKKNGIEEVWLDETCAIIDNEDTEDFGGWSVVKSRSKWRESFDLKLSRQNNFKASKANPSDRSKLDPSHSKAGNSTYPASVNNNSSAHDKCGIGRYKEESRLNNVKNKGSVLAKNSVEQADTPRCSYYTTTTTNISCEPKESTSDNDLATSDSFNDSFSNEGISSSGTWEDHRLMLSEESSPELGLYEDNLPIDPNEMYSTYMKYLNNVKEEEDFSGFSESGHVLHPEIISGLQEKTEQCQNPASLEQMTYFVNNDPIRALAFKKKLDSRIRHQEDVKKKNDEKHQLAHEKRLQFLSDKVTKLQCFVQKVKEVKAAQDQLALQRKKKLDLKLKKAEEKRTEHLNIIKRKAHDEEEKLKEIAFINELEAQNRRHDSLALRQEHEERLQSLVEERQRKMEEKAAKEAAVEERRKALEAERQEKLELIKEKRRRKEEFIDRRQQEKEQERLVIAREKAREREERLLARHTAHQAELEELQKKIQQKQEDSAKRHIESIELIRQKAIEIGFHRSTSDHVVPKYLSLYKPSINGNNSDKYKIYLKKRLKKIKSRMVERGSNYIKTTHNIRNVLTSKEAMLEKILKKLQKYEPHKIYLWQDEDCGYVDSLLDDVLDYIHEENSIKIKAALKDMKAFLYFDSLINAFNYSTHEKLSFLSLRCIMKVVTVCDLSCVDNVELALYFLLSNVIATLLDSLRFSLQALERPCKTWDLLVELLLRTNAMIIQILNALPEELMLTIPDFTTRMKDLSSYILYSGLVNRIIDLLRLATTDEKFIYKSLVEPCILFFKSLISSWLICDDLIDILKVTDLLGTVPLLYEGLMKHITSGGPLPEYCCPTISLFRKLADLDLKLFQDILGAENIALQWRGIASGLMTYCVSQNDSSDLLNSVIKLVGYFAIHNKANQTLLQSGKQPTVLQQLVKLPFKYFCDPVYMDELYPTLISCSYNNLTNKAIVENEIDYKGLENYMNSEKGKKNKIIQLLLDASNVPEENPPSNLMNSPKQNINSPD